MHINDDKKAAYYHVMKTGGSSLYDMFGRPSELLQRREEPHERWVVAMGMHGSYTQLFNQHRDLYLKIKDYYKFIFVRNPWAHAVSMYFHTTATWRFDKENHYGRNKRLNTREDYKDFNHYLKYLYRPQSEVTFDDPKFMNDDFYFFEDYENEVRRLFKRFDYSEKAFGKDVVHKNKTEKNIFDMEYPKDYRSMYDQRGIDIIADMCKDYIDKFNYTY